MRETGGASAAWVGRTFNKQGQVYESVEVFSNGIKLDDSTCSPFGAELLALEGAVDAAYALLPPGIPLAV